MTVNTMGGERPRHENDRYLTPDALALAIARKVREAFGDFRWVIEPSAGQGAFVRAAAAMWPGAPIVAIEPGSVEPGAFFGATDAMRCRWEDAPIGPIDARTLIIGNPPFSLAENHIRIALDRMRDGDVLAFLLRGSFLAGSARVRGLWREIPPARVWHIAPRPSFTGGKGTDGYEYVVVAWAKGHTGPFAGGWLEWQRG